MNPRLVAVSGPCEGQTFTLRGDSFAIGRHHDNDLPLARMEVSRHHCVVRRLGDAFTVVDLDSRHGTFVNSRPVRERRLEHSDLVTVGDTALLFLVDDSSEASAGASAEVSGQALGASTVWKDPGDSRYLDPRKIDSALPRQARIARNLNALLRISTALHETLRRRSGARVEEALAERLLGLVFEVLPAERGAVLLREPGDEAALPVAVRSLRDGDFKPRRNVVEQVLDARRGVCEEGESSLLCVPLAGHDDVLGVLYFDAGHRPAAFNEDHLELLAAIAGIASMAFDNARHLRWLQRENRRLRDETLQHDMVGESAAMRRLFDLIARVARADSTVLLRGESGTGKELAARAIHRSSARADAPFVAINCATLSATLLESELFGHEKGAFTGAVARHVGKLEAAYGGTLFLDEVGEIPPPLQAKLLRVLQERELERVGGTRPIPVDVRVVAATNRDLEAMVAAGTFRDDLYYRLKVITCELPPLRERRDDVPLLASHFAALHGRRLKRKTVGISPAARRCLMAYDWPGNVRELGNAIERAVVLGEDDVIHPEDLPAEVVEGAEAPPSDFQAAVTAAKKRLILDAWKKAGGDYSATAGLLGVHVNSLHRMIRNLGLKSRLGE